MDLESSIKMCLGTAFIFGACFWITMVGGDLLAKLIY